MAIQNQGPSTGAREFVQTAKPDLPELDGLRQIGEDEVAEGAERAG